MNDVATQLVARATRIDADRWDGHPHGHILRGMRDRFAADHDLMQLASRDMDAAVRQLVADAIAYTRTAFRADVHPPVRRDRVA